MEDRHIKYISDNNIRSHKTIYKRLMISFSISLTLLICVTYCIVSFLIMFKTFLSDSLDMYLVASTDTDEIAITKPNVMFSSFENNLLSIKSKECFTFKHYDFNVTFKNGSFSNVNECSANPKVIINGKEYDISTFDDNMNSIEFYDLSKSFDISKIFNVVDYLYEENVNRVLISRDLCDFLEISYDDIVGCHISYILDIFNPRNVYIKGNKISNLIFNDIIILNNCVISGIFEENESKNISRQNFNTPIFIVDSNYIDFSYVECNYNKKVEYKYSEDINSISASHNVFIPFGFNGVEGKNINNYIFYFNDLKSTHKAYQIMNNLYTKSYDKTITNINYTNPILCNELMEIVLRNYDLIFFFSFFFLVFILVVFLNSFYNLYQIVFIILEKNKKNIIMLNYLGCKKNDTIKIYKFESFGVLKKSSVIALTISFVFSLMFTIIFNLYLSEINKLVNVRLIINFIYYFVIIIAYFALIIFFYNITYRLIKHRVSISYEGGFKEI